MPQSPSRPPSLPERLDLLAPTPTLFLRREEQKGIKYLLGLASGVSILISVGIVLSLVVEALGFFSHVPWRSFFFNPVWSLQLAKVDPMHAFGFIPLFCGTVLIACIALFVALPIGLFSAIFLSEYATPKQRAIVKPLLEILAGIPTVVYGFFAVLLVSPALIQLFSYIGVKISSESALSAGLVMGVMLIPFISSLSDDVMRKIPHVLRDSALGLGSTHKEMVLKVVVPAAIPGICASVILAISRAIGETMLVVMAAGLGAHLSLDPLAPVTTVTVQIVALLTGDQSFDSPETLAAYALGLVLFSITLSLNIWAIRFLRKVDF